MTKNSWLACALLLSSGAVACARAPIGPSRDLTPGIELVHVKGGCFLMGTAPGTPGGPEEKPAHEVCVNDFDIGKYEVTQGQWTAVMGSNPSHFKACGSECPVEMVSWNDVEAFLGKLNARSGGQGAPGPYRLPTEAEWEYAARSGGKAEKYAGHDTDVTSVGRFNAQGSNLQPVGGLAPNGLGLHDMSGNVWEWTNDWYQATYYALSPRDNPTGPATGDHRVVRGGSFGDEAFDLRTSYRNFLPPDYRSMSKGFRILRPATARSR